MVEIPWLEIIRRPFPALAAGPVSMLKSSPFSGAKFFLPRLAFALLILGLFLACSPEAASGIPTETIVAAAEPAPVEPTVALDPTFPVAPTFAARSTRAGAPTVVVEPTVIVEPTIVLDPTVQTPPQTKAAETPQEPLLLTVDGASFDVELALDNEQASLGLSYRESLPPGTGLLFVYPEERMRTFWMFEMKFPLDMLWIDGDCKVADLSENVPIPEPGMKDSELPLYSPRVPVRHVFEINAGESRQYGIDIGDKVVFAGGLKGLHGC